MEKMVNEVMDALVGVGFPKSLEWPLRVHLCFAPVKFCVLHEQYRGADHLRYQICIVRDEKTGGYRPGFYDACLVRPLEIGTQTGSDQVQALNQQMQLVNWSALLEKGDAATVGDFADLQLVADIVDNLEALESFEDGLLYAELLKLRYWSRTPFEHYAKQGIANRSSFEVSQRFHFFSDGQGITLDEAYRFLLHRLHEKRVQGLRRISREPVQEKVRKGGKAL